MKTISEGSKAPDFELPDQDGKPTNLSDLLLNGPVVLFFYPAAMTVGCTKESCHFRDLKAEFETAGAQRVGISTDAVEKQKKFSDTYDFDYPLLSDESGEVAVAYGVRRRLITPVKRATFVIGIDQVVHKVISSELSMNVHADEALAAIAAM
jgi:thioredoxin-dependent peroxiredoxin